MENASLSLRAISLSYADTPVIRDLSLEVEPGEMLALLGASGCGKTTILKLVAGLLDPRAGSVLIDGKDMSGVPTESRRTAMVFQKPLLFPYMTVGENVGFSLKLKGVSTATIQERVREALAMVRLEGFETRRPQELSGGQEQRVSLARALVSEPRILLLDEPFAALDENLRGEIRLLVRSIQRRLRLTAIFVTHDRNEAATMTHRIAFLHDGRVSQTGALRDFYERPSDIEAARFFGWQAVRGEVRSGKLTTALGEHASEGGLGPVWTVVRPANIRIEAEHGAPATVESSVDLGAQVSTMLRLASGESVEWQHGPPELAAGQTVRVTLAGQHVLTFPRR